MAKFELLDDQPSQPATAPKARPKFELLDEGDPTGSFAENALAGVGKTFVDVGRAAGQRLREFIAPSDVQMFLDAEAARKNRTLSGQIAPVKARQLGNPIADALGLTSEADVAEARALEAPLMRTAGGKTGNFAGSVAIAAPALALPGANTYMGAGGVGALMGWLQPTAAGEDAGTNATIGTVLGGAGKYVGDKVAGGMRSLYNMATRRGTSDAAQSAVRDTTAATAKEAGYTIPPTQANPGSAWNRLLESLSGKVQTAQHASAKNQEVTNRLARQSLGIADDAPLTPEVLKGVRDKAGEAYQAIGNFGRYEADGPFKEAMVKLADGHRTLAKEVPELADDALIAMSNNLSRKDSFDGRTVLELTKALRSKADQAYAAGNKDAGRFYKNASTQVEDLIERNLLAADSAKFAISKTGGPDYVPPKDLLKNFQDARQQIAKSYSIEGALVGGNVNAQQLAAQLKRGKPLSGELKQAAEFATEFPKAAQVPQKMGSVLPGSPLDWLAAGGIASWQGDPNMMLLGLARPAARSVLLSRPYQAGMTTPSYGPGAGMRALTSMVDNDHTRRLAPAAAASAAFAE